MTDQDTDALLAAAVTIPAEEKLDELRDLALRYVHRLQRIEELEREIKEVKEAARNLAEKEIPERLQAVGLPGLKLPMGAELDLKPFCACTIPEEKKARAIKWLEEIGAGDIIKHEIVASYGRGESEQARALYQQLMALGRPVEDREYIHYQTLNAVLRRRIEAGMKDAIDPTAVDVYAGTHAKLKVPKNIRLEDILNG